MDSKTRDELIALCKAKGIKGFAGRPKPYLINLLTQAIDSHPETQLMALKEFSQRHGNTITMVFVDHGQSGIKREREQLNMMLEAARKGKFSTLYVVGIDRLSRSVKDLIEVVESLNQMGIQIHFMRENIDTRTATGSFFLTVLGSLYQLERSVMIDRINQGIARAKSQGKHCGRPSKINSSWPPTKLT